VLSVGGATEYAYKIPNPPLRCVLWEHNVGHSIRAGFADGFLFPYQEILARAAENEGINPEEFVAFAPDEHYADYSFGSELLAHDGAIASLVACAATLHRVRERIEGPWDAALAWIDLQLNRLWQARGAFPGLGSALSAFGFEWGFQHGSLLAYEIELERERQGGKGSPWERVDAVMEDPSRLDSPTALLPRSQYAPGLAAAFSRAQGITRTFEPVRDIGSAGAADLRSDEARRCRNGGNRRPASGKPLLPLRVGPLQP
jgi:hypothetical protein